MIEFLDPFGGSHGDGFKTYRRAMIYFVKPVKD
jgi:hypothetical protein